MTHYNGINDIQHSSSVDGSVYDGELNRTLPHIPHINSGSSVSHYPPSTPVTPLSLPTPLHNTQNNSASDERLTDAERMNMKRDKDAIYS